MHSLYLLLQDPQIRRRLAYVAAFLLATHVVVITGITCLAIYYSSLSALAFLAYGLGLRHAVDPDHIAAIDNTTRKLMQAGQRPVSVGFFFALGHSTIILALCALASQSTNFMERYLPALRDTGGQISTAVSCLFLLAIGLINLLVLLDSLGVWGARGETNPTGSGGLLTKLFAPILRAVDNSAMMFWIGLLFGLGFDTASEVALLGISGSTGVAAMPINVVLLIPLSFAAGMMLIDTLNGILMLGAYGWAFLSPARKLWYNGVITSISIVVALVIGGVEGLQIRKRHFDNGGDFWKSIPPANFENWGYYIVGVLLMCWLGSILLARLASQKTSAAE